LWQIRCTSAKHTALYVITVLLLHDWIVLG